jgi:hypothetical protein
LAPWLQQAHVGLVAATATLSQSLAWIVVAREESGPEEILNSKFLLVLKTALGCSFLAPVKLDLAADQAEISTLTFQSHLISFTADLATS